MSQQPKPREGTQDQIIPIDCVADIQTLQKNIDSAMALGLPECQVGELKRGKLAIVASGPSVADYVETLKSWDGEIWGINGAFHWMRHRDIEPHAFIGVDPEEILKDYLVDPPKEATYYLASQVHPGVFDHMKGFNVLLWHMSLRDINWPIGTITVQGGSSCLTRAPWLACMLGWQDVHIFGGDSSFTHKTHVYGGSIPTNFCISEANGKRFRSHKVMTVQACDMIDVVQSFPGKITVYGDGLMQSLLEQFKSTGIHEWLSRQEAREISHAIGNRKERRRQRAMA